MNDTTRRQFLQTTAALGVAASLGTLGAPAIAQARTKVKVGYLHTLAVDGQIKNRIVARHGMQNARNLAWINADRHCIFARTVDYSRDLALLADTACIVFGARSARLRFKKVLFSCYCRHIYPYKNSLLTDVSS